MCSRQGSYGPTPVRGSLEDATRAIPSGTPTFRNVRTGSCGAIGVADALAFGGVAGAGNGIADGVADDETAGAVAGVDGKSGAVALPGASTVREY